MSEGMNRACAKAIDKDGISSCCESGITILLSGTIRMGIVDGCTITSPMFLRQRIAPQVQIVD